jgi:hypothetical protein
MTRSTEKFWILWYSLLDSDDGIDETSYNALYELAFALDPKRAAEEARRVDAIDGQFYLTVKISRV